MLDCIVNRFVAALIYLSVIPSLASAADNLGVLGSKPKWSVLENYKDTITHDEFARLINDVYCTHGFAADLIKIDSDAHGSGDRRNLCRPLNQTNRWPGCGSRSTRVILAANGRRWKSAGFKLATPNR